MPPELVAAIQWAEPLIRADLAGEALTCEWCDLAAVTVTFPGRAPACGTHAMDDRPVAEAVSLHAAQLVESAVREAEVGAPEPAA